MFVLLLAALIAWALRQSRAITVVTHGGFEVYDVRYFPGTNRIFYWRAAWRDALGLVGLEKQRAIKRGPALVVYSAYPPQVGQGAPMSRTSRPILKTDTRLSVVGRFALRQKRD